MLKINKNKKEINNLLQQLMKNMKFKYKNEKNNIIYKEYYLNGSPVPKNIKYEDSGANVNISWTNENINNTSFIEKIKYKVEIRKENAKFNQVYEGNNVYCQIKNLNINTIYEFRICSYFNNCNSPWFENHKFKITYNCDSTILDESGRKNELLQKIFEWSGYKKMELLYRGTRDGPESKIFHNKCKNQGPKISL